MLAHLVSAASGAMGNSVMTQALRSAGVAASGNGFRGHGEAYEQHGVELPFKDPSLRARGSRRT